MPRASKSKNPAFRFQAVLCVNWLCTDKAKRQLAAVGQQAAPTPQKVRKDREEDVFSVSIEATDRVGGCFALAEC